MAFLRSPAVAVAAATGKREDFYRAGARNYDGKGGRSVYRKEFRRETERLMRIEAFSPFPHLDHEDAGKVAHIRRVVFPRGESEASFVYVQGPRLLSHLG